MKIRIPLVLALFCLPFLQANLHSAGQAEAQPGIYALWYSNKPFADKVFDLPYVTGGQLMVQWGRVETGKGQYDYAYLDEQVREVAERGLDFTIQFNGNNKPAWMFDEIPYHPERLSVQVQDDKGSLMWWHPTHVRSYHAFLKAMSEYIAQSPYRENIVGIRMNFNAYGTEHTHTPPENTDIGQWVIPSGRDRSIPIEEWSAEITTAYELEVMNWFVDYFSPHIRVFVRNGIPVELEKVFREDFESGKLSWFHTSSEAEPRASFAELKYGRFYDDSRSGKTVAFAEPWASAWGFHGVKRDDRWCSPPQWIYWRLLLDLHCGVSYIGVYADDLRVAAEGIYASQRPRYIFRYGPDEAFQREFDAAFRFASNYVGHHDDPEGSPGAWVAFRESDHTRAANMIPRENRALKRFNGDYNFLMKRLEDASYGQDVVSIGPQNQRYGAFARILPAGESMRLVLDETFAQSLEGKPCRVRVIFYDREGDTCEVSAGGKKARFAVEGDNVWKAVELPLAEAAFSESTEGDIILTAGDKNLYLHMVEIVRG